MVSNEDVVLIGDPEASRCGVSVQKTPRSSNLHGQIMVVVVTSFDCILNEECVSLGVVSNIVHDSQVKDVMGCDCSVVGVVDGVSNYIGVRNCSNHVEMDGIPSE